MIDNSNMNVKLIEIRSFQMKCRKRRLNRHGDLVSKQTLQNQNTWVCVNKYLRINVVEYFCTNFQRISIVLEYLLIHTYTWWD